MLRLFYGVLVSYDTTSVLMTCISNMNSVPIFHHSLIRRFYFCNKSTSVPVGLLGRWDPASKALLIHMARPGFIRG